ncbi:MAG: cell division protein ZapA [Deltaproteobacteria bacterium]|nr:cell division protein ZapA [Deltaproteobacteria bacterium]
MNSLHRVKVLGREVQVRTTASPEQVREIESFVNSTITELQASTNTADPQVIAILALLNLAESFLQQSRENHRLNRILRERLSRLMLHIDETVKDT